MGRPYARRAIVDFRSTAETHADAARDRMRAAEQAADARLSVCASERECAPLATLVFAHPTTQLDVQRKR